LSDPFGRNGGSGYNSSNYYDSKTGQLTYDPATGQLTPLEAWRKEYLSGQSDGYEVDPFLQALGAIGVQFKRQKRK
jgi:hypothetical protein